MTDEIPGPNAYTESFRNQFAADALLAMIDTPGDKHDKVRAAVDYADLLVAELYARAEQRRRQGDAILATSIAKRAP